MKKEANTLIHHVAQRLGEMHGGIAEDMVDDIGSAKWSAESKHFIAKVEFKRKSL